jgi:hypothetical protein
MYACFGLIHLVHTKSTQSQTLRQLSQCGMRLHVNWVNVEWDSTSTESTQNTPTFTKILTFRVDSVDVESHLALAQWRGMRLRVNWVTTECYKILMSRRIQEQNRKNSKALLFSFEKIVSRFSNSFLRQIAPSGDLTYALEYFTMHRKTIRNIPCSIAQMTQTQRHSGCEPFLNLKRNSQVKINWSFFSPKDGKKGPCVTIRDGVLKIGRIAVSPTRAQSKRTITKLFDPLWGYPMVLFCCRSHIPRCHFQLSRLQVPTHMDQSERGIPYITVTTV